MAYSPLVSKNMTNNIEEVYDLLEFLEKTPQLIQSRELYPFGVDRVYNDIRSRLAAPLADGTPSPFSNTSLTAGHNILIGHLAQMLDLYGGELNRLNYRTLIFLLQWLGVEILPAEYAVVLLRFKRDQASITKGLPSTIPLGLEIKSKIHQDLSVITIESKTVTDITTTEIEVMARFNKEGTAMLSQVQVGEFSQLPDLVGIDSGYNDGTIVYQGRNRESLTDACLRGRREIQLGGGRCVTASDFYTVAVSNGASKATVLPNIQKGVTGYFGSLTSVIVWPSDSSRLLKTIYESRKLIGTYISVEGADIVKLSGVIDISVNLDVSVTSIVIDAKNAIADQINPPAGLWGNRAIIGSIATTLERVLGIYAVPNLELVVEDYIGYGNYAIPDWKGKLLSSINPNDILPWMLFDVNLNNIQFRVKY